MVVVCGVARDCANDGALWGRDLLEGCCRSDTGRGRFWVACVGDVDAGCCVVCLVARVGAGWDCCVFGDVENGRCFGGGGEVGEEAYDIIVRAGVYRDVYLALYELKL